MNLRKEQEIMIYKLETGFTQSKYISLLEEIYETGIDITFETNIKKDKKVLVIISFYKGKTYIKMELYEKGKEKFVLSAFSDEIEICKQLKSVALSIEDNDDKYEYFLSVN